MVLPAVPRGARRPVGFGKVELGARISRRNRSCRATRCRAVVGTGPEDLTASPTRSRCSNRSSIPASAAASRRSWTPSVSTTYGGRVGWRSRAGIGLSTVCVAFATPAAECKARNRVAASRSPTGCSRNRCARSRRYNRRSPMRASTSSSHQRSFGPRPPDRGPPRWRRAEEAEPTTLRFGLNIPVYPGPAEELDRGCGRLRKRPKPPGSPASR